MGNMVFKEENSSIVKYWTIINCQESSCQIRSANGVKESFGRSWLLGKDGGKYVSPGIAPPPWVSSVESSVGPPAHLSIDSSGRGDSVWKHRSWCQRTRYFTLWSLSNHGWQEGLPPWLYSIVNPQRPHPTEDCPLTIPIPTHSINVWSAEQRMSKKKRGGGGGGAGSPWEILDSDYKSFPFFPKPPLLQSLNENVDNLTHALYYPYSDRPCPNSKAGTHFIQLSSRLPSPWHLKR